MTAQFETSVLDNGLTNMQSNASHVYVCSTEPTTYNSATTTATLGFKSWGAGSALTGPASSTGPTGRQVSTVAITDGTITTTGTASWWAIVDVPHTALLAHGLLSSSQVVTSGNTFSLASFNCKLADQ
jgi:hypothetical protein